jgi:hypothetical protein
MTVTIDRTEIKRATSNLQLRQVLMGDRLLIATGLVGAILTSFLLVYMALAKDSLEVVFLDKTRIDSPVLLEKVRTSDAAAKSDKWVRGFTRRFIKHFFTRPHDSPEVAKRGLAWLHAHTGKGGQHRSESLMADIDKYNETRRTRWTGFWAVNDMGSMVIRQSEEDGNVIFVEQPGTFMATTQEGKAIRDCKLRLVLRRVPVTGLDSGLGAINAVGLIVENGTIEYVEDFARPDEVTKVLLFQARD